MANKHTTSVNSLAPAAQSLTIAAMLFFTIIAAWVSLASKMASMQEYLWAGICCVFPVGWYCYGYLCTTDNQQSRGLLVTLIGWALVGTSFVVRYIVSLNANSPELTSPIALTLLLLIGWLAIVIGGIISWRAISPTSSASAGEKEA